MSQHDLDIANQTFPNTRSDLNDALQALGSTSSGATVPSTTYANQLWYDTANNKLYIRNEDNDANIEICELDQTNDSVEFFKADSIRTALVEYTDGTDAFTIGSDGTVAFDTNTLYVDATNNKVGIGTTSPDGKLHVETASSGATANTSADELVLEGTGNMGMSFLTSTTGANRIYFGDSDDPVSGVIKYDNNNDNMTFDTNGLERMRIDSSGNVGIGTSSPDSGTKLHVEESSASLTSAGAVSVALFERAGNVGISIGTANTGASTIFFQDTDSATIGRINYDHSDNSLGFWNNNTERMRIDSSGRLLVNRTSSTLSGVIQLDYEPVTAKDKGIVFNNSNGTTGGQACNFLFSGASVGNIQTTVSSTSYNTSSDYRLKENVVDMTGSIDRVKALQPKRFNFIADEDDTTVDGFLAHEVSSTVPEAISGEKDATREEEYEVTPAVLDDDGNIVTEAVMGTRTVPEYQSIDQSKLVPLLTGALQEAITKIEDLQTRITALENN